MSGEAKQLWAPIQVMPMVLCELEAAERKHPTGWPTDPIHAAAIVAEEAGEALQAANDCVHVGGSQEKLAKELAQTAAVAIRALMHMEEGGR